MKAKVFSLDAIRFLKGIQRELNESGTIEFDPAVFALFFSGRRKEAWYAVTHPITIERSRIESSLTEALLRFEKGMLPEGWEEEWREFLRAAGLRRNQPALHSVR